MALPPRDDVRPGKRRARPVVGLVTPDGVNPVAGNGNGHGISKEKPPADAAGQALVEMARLISSVSSLTDTQKAQLNVLQGLMAAKTCYALEHQPGRNTLVVTQVRGRNDDRIAAGAPGEGVVGRAFSSLQPAREEGVFAIPISGATGPLGVVVFLEPRAELSDALALALGAQMGAAWEFARLKDDAGRRNKDLQTAIAGLKNIERNREDLISNVSHELKNPLTTVKAYLAMLGQGKMGALDEKQGRAVQVAERNADRLLKMVNDLLLISRLQSGKMQLNQRPFGLRALLQEVVANLAVPADSAKVRFELQRGAEAFVKGDRERMTEAVTNMLEHAIHQTQPDGVIDVGVSTETGLAILWVKDAGTGLNDDQLGQLFESFHRIQGAGGRFEAGLGLPIVAKVAQLHGGRAEAQSKLGDGTTLRLVLPAFAAAVSLAEASRAPRSGDILLVEDDQDCREVLQELLEQESYRVMSTASVQDALDVLAQSSPAMVLLDLRLSHEDGRAVLRHIRGTKSLEEVPVYIISGASEVTSLATGTGLDRIDGFFEKPLQLQKMLDTVASVVRPTRSGPRPL